MKQKPGLMFALPALVLVTGIVAGIAGIAVGKKLSLPAETEVMPPFSVLHMSSRGLERFCVGSKAFADLSLSTKGEQKALEGLELQAVSLSDRGVICAVRGTLFTKRVSAASATIAAEPLAATILVSVTGESEVITDEFARSLANSVTVKAMASNVGNDGTVIEKVKVKVPRL